jgi:hypothetical protein
MKSTQIREFAQRLIAGPTDDAEAGVFVRDALALSEEILKQEDTVAGPRGEARFDVVMARLQATEFYRPTRTRIPEDRVGGVAGVAVEQRHTAEVQKTKDRNERLLTEIGKAGAAAGLALTTGNPAAALPLLAVIGKRLLEALTADEPATAQ